MKATRITACLALWTSLAILATSPPLTEADPGGQAREVDCLLSAWHQAALRNQVEGGE